jgi:hypothetical protein
MRNPLDTAQQSDPLVLYVVGGGVRGGGGSTVSHVYEDAGDGNNHATAAQEYRVTRIETEKLKSGAEETRVFPRDTGKGFAGEISTRAYEVRFRCAAGAKCYSGVAFNHKSLPEVPPPSSTGPGGETGAQALPTMPCFWRETEAPSAVVRVVAFLPGITQAAGTQWTLEATMDQTN